MSVEEKNIQQAKVKEPILTSLEKHYTINVLKFRTLLFFQSQINCWFSGLEFTKCLSEWRTGKIMIRLLLQKQSDLGLQFV